MAWLRSFPMLVPAACTFLLFAWLASAVERHSFMEIPGPSWTILLAVSGLSLHLADSYTHRLPGLAFIRQDSNAKNHVPAISIPLSDRAIVFGIASLIVTRLALLNFITANFQCSKPGVEYLLPIVISFLAFFTRPNLIDTQRNTKKDDDHDDDISKTIWDDLGTWIWSLGSLVPAAGRALVSVGGFLAAQPVMPSTVFCSTVSNSPGFTVFSQYLSLPIDAAILLAGSSVVLSGKTLAEKMKTFGRIFLCASLGVLVTWITGILFNSDASIFDLSFGAVLKLFIDAFGLTFFLAYGSIVFPKDGPMTPVLLLAFMFGAWISFQNIAFIGRFEAVSKLQATVPYILLCTGMQLWIAAGSLSDDLIINGVLVICTIAAMVACTTIAGLAEDKAGSHPLRTRIYRARIEQDRWELYAAISQSLKVAVAEYKERHGRDPPLGFDKWYEFATDKKSVVIDHFEQIRRDMEPFWSIPKGELDSRLKEAAALPNVETILVRGGEVTSKNEHAAVKEMEQIIEIFSQHLPDMDIPINTGEQPLILAPWHESGFHWSQVSDAKKLAKRGGTRKTELRAQPDSQPREPHQHVITRTAFRHMISDTCSPMSGLRTYQYNMRDLCTSCSEPQSKANYLRYYPESLDLCHQPDLILQHDFHLASPAQRPITKLLPMFSRTKMDAFADVLLPLIPYPTDPELKRADNKPFRNKMNRLYWRGHLPGTGSDLAVNGREEIMKKGHTARLLHLLHNGTNADVVPLVIPTNNHPSTGHYTYEHVRAREATAALPFEIVHLSPNLTAGGLEMPASLAREFGPGVADETISGTRVLDSRFVLVQDTPRGPPPSNLLATVLTSNAVPFVASLFREWYTERLYPWVHFVPLDLRWHGLHGTLAYFTGFKDAQFYMPLRNNGIGVDGDEAVGKVSMEGRWADGEWIAEQGRKWVAKTVREEDRLIYTFRLLLEWGRIVGSERKGFKLEG